MIKMNLMTNHSNEKSYISNENGKGANKVRCLLECLLIYGSLLYSVCQIKADKIIAFHPPKSTHRSTSLI